MVGNNNNNNNMIEFLQVVGVILGAGVLLLLITVVFDSQGSGYYPCLSPEMEKALKDPRNQKVIDDMLALKIPHGKGLRLSEDGLLTIENI